MTRIKTDDLPEIYTYGITVPKSRAPEDLVVNVGNQVLILDAPAHLPREKGRIEVGDRRQGEYYTEMCLGKFPGLMRVRDCNEERLMSAEQERQLRLKIIPPEWVIAARKKEAEGKVPPPIDDARTTLSPLQQAAKGITPEE